MKNFWRTLNAVLWSFFGVRKGEAHQRDLAQIKPVHLVLVGLFAAALFVALLLILVRLAIAYS